MAADRAGERKGETGPAGGRRGLTRRRLLGIDRSGPEPPETRAGQPLRPLTVPNLLEYLRLGLIPVFLVLAFGSEDGRATSAVIVYALIAGGDYVDGMLARVTGQYSRLGALLDPVVDRIAVLAAVGVCWHFALLPRWMLAALALREATTPLLARYGLHKGLDLEINWLGRIAAFLVFVSLLGAMIVDSVALHVSLITGVGLAWAATVLYVREGRRRARAQDRAQTAPEPSS